MASKDKKFSFSFNSGEIAYTSIRKSASGYNYASVGIKRGDDEYINIDYEWKSKDNGSIPDLIMDQLAFMSANKKEIEKASKELIKEYKEFSLRLVESK